MLLAAALHASWNALLKGSRDPLLALATMVATAGLCGLILATVAGPPPRDVWPYLGFSMLLHAVYHVLLARAYTLGDLSQIYPIARGVAPPLLALLAAMTLEEWPDGLQAAGLLLASVSIATLGIASRARERLGVGYAMATGAVIASYSLIDGYGSRVSGVLLFIAWSHLLDTLAIAAIVWYARRGRVREYLRTDGWRGVAGGLIGIATYSIVLWAMTRAPLAQVSMLRETSVIFAALLGAFALREPLGLRRTAAAVGVCIGTGLLLL